MKTKALLMLVALAASPCLAGSKVTLFFDEEDPQITFAAQELQAALEARDHMVGHAPLARIAKSQADPCIVLGTKGDESLLDLMRIQGFAASSSLKPEGFSLRKSSTKGKEICWIVCADNAGTMYGGLELAEVVRCSDLNGIQSVDQNPYMPLRGIKFNCPLDERTPTYSNHNGDAQQKNVLVMWDMTFWKAYIDDLARSRYNYLSLWNLHPFPSMVRVPGYEKVALEDVESTTQTLKMTMEEKIKFWRRVMRYAKDRNVDIYVVTWNIFIPGKDGIRSTEGPYGLTHKFDNPVTTDYFRKSVKQMFLTYPDLAGIGLTTGERMPDLTVAQKETWAFNTYGKGVLDAAAAQPGRKIKLIHRQHQTGAQDIAKIFQPLLDHPDIDFIFSFKYAKAHVMSSTEQPYCNDFVKDIGSLKTIWTLRNDSNYYFRWGAPDFVRKFIQNIPYEVSKGFYYGADGYVWGREFLSTEPATPRQLEMAKHWYHWMLWGRLGYDPDLTNDRLIQMLAARYPQVPAENLFTAWQEASMVYPVTTGFHWGALDFQWYIEGCFSKPKSANTTSGFHDVNRFITLGAHPGTDNVDIPDYVDAVVEGKPAPGTTPIQVSQRLHNHADKALRILDRFPKVADKELRLTLGDIRAMAYLGKYYGHKIRGATELALYRKNKEKAHQDAAVREMTQAAQYWDRYIAAAQTQYTNPILLNRAGLCDWRALRDDVQKDIIIAGGGLPEEKKPPEETVLFIRDPNSDRAQHDLNIIAALGKAGITIDGVNIPGLGLSVRTIDPDSLEEAETYSFAQRTMILISDTIASGDVANHADDPLPVVCMESSLFERGGMFFSSDSGNISDMPRMAIVDASHPITSVFGAGEIRFSRQSGDDILGVLQGNMAAGAKVLAHNPQNIKQPCLVILDQGDTPLPDGGRSGYDPAPARRVCLGYQQNAFVNPTVDGVILLQRTVQWALGERVTAAPPKP